MAGKLLRINIHIPLGDTSAVRQLGHSIRPQWEIQDISLKSLHGGIINELWKCSKNDTDCEAIIVKIQGSAGDGLVNRHVERQLMELFHMEDIFPLCCSFDNGFAYQFIPGEILTEEQLMNPQIYGLLIEKMHEIHLLDPRKQNISLDEDVFVKTTEFYMENWMKMGNKHKFEEQRPNSVPSYDDMTQELMQIFSLYDDLKSEFPACCVHFDINLRNIIFNQPEGKLSLIDYELCGYASEIIDMAVIFTRDPYVWFKNAKVSIAEDEPCLQRFVQKYLETHPSYTEVDEALVDKWMDGLYRAMQTSILWNMFVLYGLALGDSKVPHVDYSGLGSAYYALMKRIEQLVVARSASARAKEHAT